MKNLVINAENANQRLDKFLLKYLNQSSKAFIYKMLRKKRIKLNNKKAEGNEILQPSDVLSFYISEETLDSFKSEKILKLNRPKHLEIIYEDSNILIINKEQNLLSHPESKNDKDSLIDRILFYLHEKNEFDLSKNSVFTPALCNRLDRNTTGIVICGKNLAAVQEINRAISDRKISKYYFALVSGVVKENKTIQTSYYKDSDSNTAFLLQGSGNDNEIVTIIEPISNYNNYTLLRINLVTGKSHQIRLHLKSIGNPIVGDRKYGDEKINRIFEKIVKRQLLHAGEIIFSQMSGNLEYLNNKKFTSTLPRDFEFALKYVGKL